MPGKREHRFINLKKKIRFVPLDGKDHLLHVTVEHGPSFLNDVKENSSVQVLALDGAWSLAREFSIVPFPLNSREISKVITGERVQANSCGLPVRDLERGPSVRSWLGCSGPSLSRSHFIEQK